MKKLLVGRGKKPQQIVHNFGGIEKSPLPNKSHGSDGRGFLKATHQPETSYRSPLPLLSSCLNCLTRGLASSALIGSCIEQSLAPLSLRPKGFRPQREPVVSLLLKQLSSSTRCAEKYFFSLFVPICAAALHK